MKAILVNNDKSLRWADVPDPVLGAEDVMIQIKAAGINRADLMQRDGNYPPPAGCPEWMGLEVAGVITAVGAEAAKKSSWKVGDEVCALLGGGGYAEYVNVKYDMVMPIPKGISMVQAAALPEVYSAAYLNLFIEGGAKAGDTLLMTGGAGGLASVVIPMAKATGLRVVTTVLDARQAEAIKDLGADLIVNMAEQDLAKVLEEEKAAGRGVDIAIDCVCGPEIDRYLHHLNWGARWIIIAAMAGEMAMIDLRNLYRGSVRLIGNTLRARTPEVKAQILNSLVRDIWPKVESGEVLPTIHGAYPITKTEEAQALLYEHKNVGKVVLTVE